MFLNHRDAPPLLGHADVPARVTESYILTGYRFPTYTLRQCLLSAFRPTNETGNFWTHFLPVFVFAYHLVEVFWWDGAPPPGDPFFYPLWNYVLGVLFLLAASSLAHLLNSMSLVVREVCFFVDYGTISAYTVGSSLAYYYYIHPRAGVLETGQGWAANGSSTEPPPPPPPSLLASYGFPGAGALFEAFYVPSSCVVAIICILSCCNTRQRWRRHRYLIRTLVFLLPFLVSSTPIFYRLLTRSPYPPASASFASSASMAGYFYRHCLWLVVSAVFNISKVPERLAPGRFDVWGHSHQWFHCCTFLSILDEFHMIKAEVRAVLLRPMLALPEEAAAAAALTALPGPTAPATYGVMLLLQATIAAIIGWFSWHAERIYGAERDQLARQGPKGHKCH
ncbi:membrane progesterone receptor epsilon [Gadus morhua]|uniref:Progestin and adipoQ receptor family member 9 n=1 Tax=Gadus morhua TaxID=8049 RepID=A0A8C5A7M3_GADMO|nr:membrane progestin receptor epsilon [Gadus morhua]